VPTLCGQLRRSAIGQPPQIACAAAACAGWPQCFISHYDERRYWICASRTASGALSLKSSLEASSFR